MLRPASQGPPARSGSDAQLPPGEALPHAGVGRPRTLSPPSLRALPFISADATSSRLGFGHMPGCLRRGSSDSRKKGRG